MGQLSDRWYLRFSDEWWDVGTPKGFLIGICGGLLNLLGFIAVTALAILATGVRLEQGTPTSTVAFWTAGTSGVLAGGVFVYVATVDPVLEFWRTLSGRAITNLVKYGVFWLFLLFVPFLTVVAGFGFVIGRILTHIGLFVGARFEAG